jgi:hypothetical protein
MSPLFDHQLWEMMMNVRFVPVTMALAILLFTSACTFSDIPIESAGPPSNEQDSGGGY